MGDRMCGGSRHSWLRSSQLFKPLSIARSSIEFEPVTQEDGSSSTSHQSLGCPTQPFAIATTALSKMLVGIAIS